MEKELEILNKKRKKKESLLLRDCLDDPGPFLTSKFNNLSTLSYLLLFVIIFHLVVSDIEVLFFLFIYFLLSKALSIENC